MRQLSELRPYQQRLVTHLYDHDEAFCVVRPGGGKTVVALTAIEELLRDKVIRHALVVAPKRVAHAVWPDEIEQWAHIAKLRYLMLDGNPGQREVLLRDEIISRCDVTIIGLDLVQWLLQQLDKLAPKGPIFDLLVIDEISRLRNPKGERAKALAKNAHRWKMIWGLSGTLRPSGPEDLFMPVRVVTRGKLWGKSYYAWRQKNFYPADFNGYTWKPFEGAEGRLNAEIAPLVATVAEGELIQATPQIILDRVDLPGYARTEYDRMNRRLVAEAGDKLVVASSAAVATGKMAQMANGFIYDETTSTISVHDVKLNWLKDIQEEATGPTLVIYEYREDLAMLRQVFGQGLPYLGAGVANKDADRHIDRWNKGELPFMALHPASGGHGLNLQHGGADMAWVAPCWSPEYWEQTIARINRSGQTRQVVVRVCVAGGTVDELKLDRVHHKMTAQAAFEAYLARWQAPVAA